MPIRLIPILLFSRVIRNRARSGLIPYGLWSIKSIPQLANLDSLTLHSRYDSKVLEIQLSHPSNLEVKKNSVVIPTA